MSKIKVLIVDDSAYSRQTIKKILEEEANIEVVDIAYNGIEAMAKTIKLKPDLITLDIEMPEMNGFTFLRWLMKKYPTPVIIVSSHSDSQTVFKALDFGAVDFVAKPSRLSPTGINSLQKDLINKIRAIKQLKLDRLSKTLELDDSFNDTVSEEYTDQIIKAVGIGASTGGPAALKQIITQLPFDYPCVVVSQHMPRGFTSSFAERLNTISKVYVKEAEEEDELENGRVLICPGGYHMSFKKKGEKVFVSLSEAKMSDKYIPSIDTMMSSLAETFGQKAVGVILTGMGSDGKQGMMEIKRRGGYTIVESEETAVVFGMPNEVIKAGAAKIILPLSDIPIEMIKLAKRSMEDK
jgi:two-component system chemotaxis response regulator CheB